MRLSFGGHESFPFRLGWIRKGVVAAEAACNAFSADEAVVRLGVGKNMVRSIRTWCLATQMLLDEIDGATRLRGMIVSDIAKVIFADDGDPYLEDPATLWLLHWLLVSNPDRLSLWRLAIMESKENDFTKGDLVEIALKAGDRLQQKVEATQVSRDVDVFIRTYTAGRSGASEEDFSCPLVDLGLISTGSSDRFSFVVGPKRNLPADIFAFSFVQFLQSRESSDCSLSDVTYLPGSPGQAFRLDEDTVVSFLRDLEARNPKEWLVDVDGPIRRIGIRTTVDPLGVLRRYYLEAML